MRLCGGQVLNGSDGNFEGTDAIAGEIVNGDAQEVCALGGDADLLLEGDATVRILCVEGGGEICFDGIAHGVDECGVGVVDEGDDLNRAVTGAIGGGGKGDGG